MPDNSGPRKQVDYQADYRPEKTAGSSSSSKAKGKTTVEPRKEGQSYMDYYRSSSPSGSEIKEEKVVERRSEGQSYEDYYRCASPEDDTTTAGSVVAEHGSDAGSESGKNTFPNIRATIRQAHAKGGEGSKKKEGVIIGTLRPKKKEGDGESQK